VWQGGKPTVPLIVVVADGVGHGHDVHEAGPNKVREPLAGGGSDALREGGEGGRDGREGRMGEGV